MAVLRSAWFAFALGITLRGVACGSEEAASPLFSHDSGFYDAAFEVTVTSETASATIHYTTDCSEPTTNSAPYAEPIAVTNTTALRAAAFADGLTPSAVATRTYLFPDEVVRQPANPAGFPAAWVSAEGQSVPADYEMNPQVAGVARCRLLLRRSLLSLATVSIVTETKNLFDKDSGIYVNPAGTGKDWERPASIELISSGGETGFQVSAGLRIAGTVFRDPVVAAKHSFRVLFKKKYGAAKLTYGLFDGDSAAVDEFDSLVLRAGAWDSWSNAGAGASPQYVRDEFGRRTQLAMGRAAPHGRFVHVYLNGLYWGVYNLAEQPEAFFAESYFGGDEDNWDVIDCGKATDGNLDAWEAMMAQVRGGLAGREAYQRIQGNSPDGTPDPIHDNLLDVSNYADYMIYNLWAGNTGWPATNWFAARDQVGDDGFRFLVMDSELSLGLDSPLDVDRTSVSNGVAEPYAALKENSDFLRLFADRLHKHLSYDGALTTDAALFRYGEVADEVELAAISESARWGDHHGEPPYTLAHWRNQRNWMEGVYLKGRPGVFLNQCRAAGLYRNVDAPVFSRHGGLFTSGFMLSMSASNTIFYTLDGSDPRDELTGVPHGALYTNAIELTRNVEVKARAMADTNSWSALTRAVFTLDEDCPLRITEIMYHPREPRGAETNGGYAATDFEFIELRNTAQETVGLAGIRFTDGIAFDFTESEVVTLEANAYTLVVKNLAAFTNRYPNWQAMNIAGEFDGRLSDGGEGLVLRNGWAEENVLAFSYDDERGWPLAADGAGHSLIPRFVKRSSYEERGNWSASAYTDGSPGATELGLPGDVSIAINEVVARSDLSDPQSPVYDPGDWIELYNAATSSLQLADWYLSDDCTDLKKWAIPPATEIAVTNWLCLDGTTLIPGPSVSGFGLARTGGRLYLSHLPGTGADRVADCIHFQYQENDTSYGCLPDGVLYRQTLGPTPGTTNALSSNRYVVISEIVYHPLSEAIASDEDEGAEYTVHEFIELHNPTDSPVALWNSNGTWRIADGVDYRFAPNTTLEPHGYLTIVSFDPGDSALMDDFLDTYGIVRGDVTIVGPYAGKLSNRGERIVLERPQSQPVAGLFFAWVIVDEVVYSDRSPWPSAPDGSKYPLQRRPILGHGSDPRCWSAGLAATPGSAPLSVAITQPVDGEAFPIGSEILVGAAIDRDYVVAPLQHVEFLLGTNSSVDNTEPFECTFLDADEPGPRVITARLTDSMGTHTSPAVGIIVYGPPEVLTIEPGDVTDESARMRGELTAGGMAVVTIYWGLSDGGETAENWDRVVRGSIGEGPFSLTVNGLPSDTTYFYRCYAFNSPYDVWADTTESFTTRSYDEWAHIMKVAFHGYTRPGTLTNFPVLIELDDDLSGFSHNQFASSASNDLRFLDPGGITGLSYEIEQWDSGGVSRVWVRLPELSGSNDYVWVLWGAGGLNEPPLNAIDGSTWSDGYAGVWHLDETPAYSELHYDAAPFGNDGVWHGYTCIDATGVICGAADLGTWGHPDYIDVGDDRSLEMASFSLSAWVKAAGAGRMAVVSRQSGDESWFMALNDNRLELGSSKDGILSAHGPVLNDDRWHHVCVTRDAGRTASWHVDGTLVHRQGITSMSGYRLEGSVEIGRRNDSSAHFHGILDEVRISSEARPADWVWACWMNQVSNDAFNSYVTEEMDHRDHDGDGMPDAWEQWYFQTTNALYGGPHEDHDSDGIPNRYEYIAGTDPTDETSRFRVNITHSNQDILVSFPALEATGNGYTRKSRFYDLEEISDVRTGRWWQVAGFTNILGNNVSVIYTTPPGRHPRFYRARTRLQ